ncbi:CDP-4-dehydro-6-deoxyglucose reductase [Alkalispirillum mobile]|uniref:CDP-4-dehydro-6-deoxyglucose reductase n=1 Tax=Alkalispirillum mobile TaxID=85925 RepID=A0A498C7J3_9GAMM|nr:CDP-6-deoxy-delta-3,4-glucoseen reductase [Alkalispirillum mobile]RLK48211.1 CDP-4-dehydro-6-deoxyglucose reductase [Alkalispirillum mobile]
MSYKVLIERTGHEFTVEEGESILDAALHHGLILPYSCRGGSCGACMGKVISGEIDYPAGRPDGLSDTEEAVGQALFCQARPRSDLSIEVRELREAGDLTPRKMPTRVVRIEDLAHDVRRLWLKLPKTERLQYLAGQYVDVLLRDGRRRGFSLANPPHDDELLELHVRHVPGGEFTGYVFNELKEKALLRIEGPLGTFALDEESDRPVVMLAGGTGFAPIKAMVEHALYVGIRRPIHIYWGVRARRDLYLDGLPRRWASEHEHVHYVPVLSEPQPEDNWQGRIGLVHNILLADIPNLAGYDVYVAGPPGMISAAKRDLLAHGLPEARFFYDSFEYSNDRPVQE